MRIYCTIGFTGILKGMCSTYQPVKQPDGLMGTEVPTYRMQALWRLTVGSGYLLLYNIEQYCTVRSTRSSPGIPYYSQGSSRPGGPQAPCTE